MTGSGDMESGTLRSLQRLPDGFRVAGTRTQAGRLGLMARHISASTTTPARKGGVLSGGHSV